VGWVKDQTSPQLLSCDRAKQALTINQLINGTTFNPFDMEIEINSHIAMEMNGLKTEIGFNFKPMLICYVSKLYV